MEKKKLISLLVVIVTIILSVIILFGVLFSKKIENPNKEVDQLEYKKINNDGTISFTDQNFSKAIKSFLNKKDIYPEDALKMKSLILDNKNIKSIAGIEFFENLEYLSLEDNCIEDISYLKYLQNLRILDLHNNMINKIQSISVLSNLEYLTLSSNRIEDISPLINLKKLQSLPATYNNNVYNLEVLEDNLKLYYDNSLTNYYEINIEGNKVSYIREFDGVSPNCDDGYIVCTSKENYKNNVNEIKTYKQAMKVANEFIKDNIKDNMSDFEKEIIIINYIIDNLEYGSTDGEVDGTHDFYYPFVLKYGQCHNYAQEFNLLASLAGLESYSAFAGALHEWNIVKIDDKYYHLDLTWADGLHDSSYINISTKTMNELHGEDVLFTEEDKLRGINLNNDMDRKIITKKLNY